MKILVRKATPADATDIARVHVLSWQNSYRDLIDADYLEQMRVGESEDKWLRRLSEANDVVLVAEIDGQLVGFVHARKQAKPEDAYEAELCAIYVLKEFQRHGVGRLLFQEMMEKIKSDGFHSMNVWVLSKNQTARDFYAAMKGQSSKAKDSLKIGEKEYPLSEYCWEKLN